MSRMGFRVWPLLANGLQVAKEQLLLGFCGAVSERPLAEKAQATCLGFFLDAEAQNHVALRGGKALAIGRASLFHKGHWCIDGAFPSVALAL